MLKFRIPKTLSSGERKFWAIKDILDNNNRTLEEEYELILKKESTLTKSQRDYVELMVMFKTEFNTHKNEEE